MRQYKILVTGPFNAGKTTLIKTLCKRVIGTDKALLGGERRVKETTTVAFDFGLLTNVEGATIRLFGTPGQEKFSFMWRALSAGMNGYIVMVDSSDPSRFLVARRIYEFFRSRFPNTPHLVAANKFDLRGHASIEEIRDVLRVPLGVPVLPTVALDAGSAMNLIRSLIKLIQGRYVEVEGGRGVFGSNALSMARGGKGGV